VTGISVWTPLVKADSSRAFLFGRRLFDAIRACGVKRLLFDGLEGLEPAAIDEPNTPILHVELLDGVLVL
jgi:hypothetical protein